MQVPTLLLGRVLGKTLADLPPGSLANDTALKQDIVAGAEEIWRAGFAMRDIHLGNIMLWGQGQGNGRRSAFIDFEDAEADANAREHELPKLQALLRIRCPDSSDQAPAQAYEPRYDDSPFAAVPGWR